MVVSHMNVLFIYDKFFFAFSLCLAGGRGTFA